MAGPVRGDLETLDEAQARALEAIIREAATEYFDECHERVDSFVAAHFLYPGAWRTNRLALGWDLLRAPVNLFWAPLYITVMLLGWLARRCGLPGVGVVLAQLPAGCQTRVQRHIAELIQSELLQSGGGDELAQRIALALRDQADSGPEGLAVAENLETAIADTSTQYGVTRTATADIANSLASTVLGAFAFKQFTPGGIALGLLLASGLAQRQAREGFFLGEFLGGIYYSLFPAEPTLGLQVAGIAAALACLAAFASLSGLLTDPLQAACGLHRHRLNKMIDSIERDFLHGEGGSFNPKSPYLARVLELLDAAKIHLA
jgi:hypothetical protein